MHVQSKINQGRIRPIKPTRGFHFDPKRDTLKVWKMQLPDSDPYGEGHRGRSIPVRKLLTVFPYALNPYDDVSTGVSDPAWNDEHFDTDLDLSFLPMIEEATLAIQSAGWEWHIEGFQMYGPDVVESRGPNDNWVAGGMDTSVCLPKIISSLEESEAARGTAGKDVMNAPYIGFRGYSKGTYSLGGNWPGFRYYTDTGEVEFSPLSFSEISFATDRQDTPKREPVDGRDAQLVSRVWIIRPGRPARPVEPHHCWIKVKKWEMGDPDWVWQMETTWKMVRGMLCYYTKIDRGHGLHVKYYESIVSSKNWKL
ncbi:hypothetical protein LCI18_015120 [Fusarium solani-melongenae]|uniref:Uncharacterized protein n=1 Tax=Fusarium solani subsp. cucurbitae TaxID=2747967 RepID=A0ACD3ZSX0_FUSSC|nr:hypothetical protein LCI18_015120 [Fusarium solani-melongenae]